MKIIMEIITNQLPSILDLTSLFLFLTFLITLLHKARQWKNPKAGPGSLELPPGPPKLPVIGNLHNLVLGSFTGGPPHVVLKNLSEKYAKDLMHLQLGQVSALVVSSTETAREFLKTHDVVFAERPPLQCGKLVFYGRDIVFSTYGDYWREMRKVCVTELLSTVNVRAFGPIRYDETRRLVQRVRATCGEAFNLHDQVSLFSRSVLCRTAFGKVPSKAEEFVKTVNDILFLMSGFSMLDMFPSWKILRILSGSENKVMKLHHKVNMVMEDIIKEHKQNLSNGMKGSGDSGAEDMVDVLLRFKDNGSLSNPITDENVKAIMMDMFGAGTESSTTTIVCSLVEMIRKPDILAKAQAEVRRAFKAGTETLDESVVEKLPYLNMVVKETLRLHVPSAVLLRHCRKETVVRGYVVPANTNVLVNCWAMSRDPRYWEDPERFMPERFENNTIDVNGNHYEYLPFGSGRRICPGILFGFASVLLPLANLIYHFDWRPPHGVRCDELKLNELFGIIVGVKNDIFLVATPHATTT